MGRIIIFIWVVREDLTDKVIFEGKKVKSEETWYMSGAEPSQEKEQRVQGL